MDNMKMDRLIEKIISNRAKYKKTVNLKINQYSTTGKSELFFYDEEKDIFIGLGPKYKNSGCRSSRHDWGFGCGHCPACELRRKGWNEWRSRRI